MNATQNSQHAADILARIAEVAPESPAATAVGGLVERMAGVPEIIEYDALAGGVTFPQMSGRTAAAEETRDETDAARQYLMAQAESSPEYLEGLRNLAREREQRARERAAKELALEMAGQIKSYAGRYLFFRPEMRDAYTGILTLWAIHTHAYRAAGVSPRLAIIAPTKGAGKTTVMEVLSTLANNPSPMGVTPTAPTIKLMAGEGMTIFLDEIDTLTKGAAGGEIAAVLNSGYKAGGAVLRVGRAKGAQYLDKTSTFSPVAFAGIANEEGRLPLPAATMDRAVTIRIDRATGAERPAKFRVELMRDDDEVTELRNWAHEWTLANFTALRDSNPELPPLSSSRAEQIWEPLFSIAHLLGGEFADKIAGWATLIDESHDQDTDADPRTAFIADVRDVLATWVQQNATATRIKVDDLVSLRNTLEGRRVRESISPVAFGKRLGAFGVKSKVAKVNGQGGRVYEVCDGAGKLTDSFSALFARYAD